MMVPFEEWIILWLDKVQLVKKVLRRRCKGELAPIGGSWRRKRKALRLDKVQLAKKV
jgi:hypothetical protein